LFNWPSKDRLENVGWEMYYIAPPKQARGPVS
jgi:hypothetical protein